MQEESMVSFSTLDRCDRCGAQAYAQAEKWGLPSNLMFCSHHSHKYENALLDTGWTIRWDEQKTKELVGTPGGSAW